MNSFIKKLFGIDKIEAEVRAASEAKMSAMLEAEQARLDAEKAKKEFKAAQESANLSKMEEKAAATAQKLPYIAVLKTHVNDQNLRNGFFELDWNEYFIIQLKAEGYEGETEEQLVDQWWREICRNVAAEDGLSVERRASGYINVNRLGNGKTEIS
jgi:DNA-binding transcriptional regulator YdaS (Cro superfamily)